MATDDDIVCTFTNTRDRGAIELRKVWVGVPGQTTLQIGTTAGDDDIDTQLTGVAGAPPLTTDSNPVDTGTYFISEVGGLTGYTTSVACFNDIGGGTGGVANDGIKNGSEPTVTVGANGAVIVGKNADVVCTFTNSRFLHPGTIGFWKNWRNHYTTPQITTIINYIITHNEGLRHPGSVNPDLRRDLQLRGRHAEGPADPRSADRVEVEPRGHRARSEPAPEE